MDTKSSYEELDIPTWDMDLDKLEDFVRRARAAGHNTFDIIAQRGYYDDIDGYTMRSEYSESTAIRKATTPNT